jgi:hypothetical protein
MKEPPVAKPNPASHAEDRNLLEKILRKIPGFKGYLEKEYRRESDYLARTWLADRLQASKRGLDDYVRNLVDAGELDSLTQCDRLRSKVDKLVLGLRGAVRGYSGFFDFVKVREEMLDEVYKLDISLTEEVDKLAADIEGLASKSGDCKTLVSDLSHRVDEIDRKYDERAKILQGLKSA